MKKIIERFTWMDLVMAIPCVFVLIYSIINQ